MRRYNGGRKPKKTDEMSNRATELGFTVEKITDYIEENKSEQVGQHFIPTV